MAETNVPITAGSGTAIDGFTLTSPANIRQAVVIGDKSTNAAVAPVDATKGLAVDLTNTGANTNKLLVTPDLPSGASTAAKQPALGTAGTASSDVITVQGITSMTALKVDGSGVTQPISATNLSTNMAQVAGTATDVNSGNKSAGTQRVVIATDQPQLTNALKVDGSGVTQPISGTVMTNADGSTSGGTAGTKSLDVGGIYNTSAPSLTTGQQASLQLDSSGNLKVTGSLSVGGTTDEAAWTAATSTFNPTGGVFNDSAAALTSGQQGTQRFTANRAGHANLRNASGTELATTSNPLQTQIGDGTNQANILAGDSGFNGLISGSAAKSITFTTSGSGSQVLGPYNCEGYSTITVVVTSNTTSGLVYSGQFSQTSGGTYVNTATFINTANGIGALSTLTTGTTGQYLYSRVVDNYFRLNVTALTSGTLSGTITLSNNPYINQPSTNVNNTISATVSSGANTGASVPGNAFYMGISDQSAKLIGAVSANTAAGTTGNGLLGVGNLGYDGANWQYISVTSHALNVSTTQADIPTSIFNGQVTVTTPGTRVQFSSQAVKSVTIKALSNAGKIYVGNSSVTSSNGFQLLADDSISFDITNLNTIYIDADNASEGVTYIGVN